MITQILTQIWNKRRANVWIFLELVLVTFFMWGVIDPVYVLLSNQAIPQGYDTENVLRLSVGQYSSGHARYSEEQDTDQLRQAAFEQIYNKVKQYPGVESAVIVQYWLHPYTRSYHGWTVKHDSIELQLQQMRFYQDGDFFKVFRMKDCYTDTIPNHRLVSGRAIYITKDVAERLMPDKRATGMEVYNQYDKDTLSYKIAGVMPNFKTGVSNQPEPTSFSMIDHFNFRAFPDDGQICFRIRDGVSKAVFITQFKSELAPQLSVGNLHFLQLDDFDVMRSNWEYTKGIKNKLRLQAGLTLFFLICTFLGIAGTFWLRSDARKGEIGLRMALGSSKAGILKAFFIESWLLTTVAWLVGVIFVLQRVYYTGFAEQPRIINEAYLQNRFIPHFLIVSAIVYLLILFIAMMGTWIPARQAAATEPAEALRSE